MIIETVKKRLAAALEPHLTEVNKCGDYMRLSVKLANNSELTGYYELGADPDFESIVAQCEAAEAKKAIDALYIIDGSTIILANAFAGYKMTEVVIPGSVRFIQGSSGYGGYGAFKDCPNLERVTICEGVTTIGGNTFCKCKALKSVTIPESVKRIRGYAFYECSSLKDVKLPTGLEVLGSYAFANCESLTSIDLPKSITELDGYVFDDCKSLQAVSLPEGMTEIPNYMFNGCTSLNAIKLPESLKKIGYAAFSDCESLQEIVIPASVTEIGGSAFSGCISIKAIEVPEGVSTIESSTFRECQSLMEVKLPESVTEIGESTFRECTSLQNIAIPASVTEIDEYAFYKSALTSISLPAACKLGDRAFYGTCIPTPIIQNDILNYVPVGMTGRYVIPDGVKAIEAHAFEGCNVSEVVIPASVGIIGSEAFLKCEKLTHIDIPGPVEKINDSTFSGCTSLSTVKLPDSLTQICYSAFAGSGLTSIVLPPNVRCYSDYAFSNCTQLVEVTITNPTTPLSASSFSNDAFKGCTAITVVNLPKGITWGKIKEKFKDSPWSKTNPKKSAATLKAEAAAAKEAKLAAMENATYEAMAKAAVAPAEATVTVGRDFIEVKAKLPEQSALYAWYSLKNTDGTKVSATDFDWTQLKNLVAQAKPDTTYCVYAPETKLTKELVSALKDYTGGSANVVLLSGVTEIAAGAFANYSALRSITLPEGLTNLGEGAFKGTSLMHPVVLDGKLYAAPTGAINGEYVVPADVVEIMDYAFDGCDTITSVVVAANVWLVRDYAFRGCKALNKVQFANPIKFVSVSSSTKLEEGYTLIDKSAFKNSDGITELAAPNSGSILGWLLANLY